MRIKLFFCLLCRLIAFTGLFAFTHSAFAQSFTTTVEDPDGEFEAWTFIENLDVPLLTSRTLADGLGYSQQYDAQNNLVSRTDEEGRTTTWVYNTQNQKTSMTEAAGTPEERTTTYTYLSPEIDLVTQMVEPSILSGSQRVTTTTYDSQLNPTSVTIAGFRPDGSSITRTMNYGYNAIGQVISIDGGRLGNADTTTMSYYDCDTGGGCGKLASVTNALGHTTVYNSYNDGGQLLLMTDANGTSTSYTYDGRYRVETITVSPSDQSESRQTSYTYTDRGEVETMTDPTGLVVSYQYDDAHYLRSVTDNLGNQITYGYDIRGNRNQTQTFDPDGTLARTVDTEYTRRSFVNQINAAGSVTQTIKDAVGNLTSTIDPNQNVTTYQYDALNRLQEMTDALGSPSSYDYDVRDNLVEVVAPNGATTNYDYDDLGNLLREESPDRGVRTYTHDAAGNVISMTDARGVVVNYSYDSLNRLVSVDYPGEEEDITYVYDQYTDTNTGENCGFGIGAVCYVQDQGGETLYQYDPWGNPVSVKWIAAGQAEESIISYEYDAANRVVGITYPSGREVIIARDSIGRTTDIETTVESRTTKVISNRTYRGDGLMIDHLIGNGINEVRNYDLQGRLIDQITPDFAGRTYDYDANGNLQTLTDEEGLRQFSYDVLDRLDTAAIDLSDLDYAYDPNGNRLSLAKDATTETLSYLPASNRLDAIDGTVVSLDAAGNTTSDQNGRLLEYNQSGRLSRILEGGVEVASYEYNAKGQRVTKTTPTEVVRYQYNLDGTMLTEVPIPGAEFKEYIYLDSTPLAMIVSDGFSANADPVLTIPGDLIIEATGELTAVDLGIATAVDAEGAPLVSVSDVSGPFALGFHYVVWTATDSQGRSVSRTQTILVQDTTPPELTIPDDISVEVYIDDHEPLLLDIGQASAPDSFSVTVSNDAPDTFGYGITVVNWTAVDANGNTSSAQQTIRILLPQCSALSNLAPAGVASQTSDYSSTYVASKAINNNTGDITLTDTTDTNPSWTVNLGVESQISQIVIHKGASCCGDRQSNLDVRIEDVSGAEKYRSEILNPNNVLSSPEFITIDLPADVIGNEVTIERNGVYLSLGEVEVMGCAAPVLLTLSDPADQGFTLGEEASLQIEANHLLNTALTYSASGLPEGVSIDASTGLISGASTEVGGSVVTVSVTDGTRVLSETFSWTTVEPTGECSVEENIALQGTASQTSDRSRYYTANNANDGSTTGVYSQTANGDANPSWTLALGVESQISRLVIHKRSTYTSDIHVRIESATGVEKFRSETLNPGNISTESNTITIDLPVDVVGNNVIVEKAGSRLELREVEVIGCLGPIVLTLSDPVDQGFTLGEEASLQIEANHLLNTALTYSASGLPEGVSIDASTGLISGASTEVGGSVVTVSVTDGTRVLSETFSWTTVEPTGECSVEENIALQGTASQTSTVISIYGASRYVASNAINNVMTDVSHTESSDTTPSWNLDLGYDSQISELVIHNRDECCAERLSDITLVIEDEIGVEKYRSEVLNPNNILSGPDFITIDLPIDVIGKSVTIEKSGASLGLGEVVVMGCAANLNGANALQPDSWPPDILLSGVSSSSSINFMGGLIDE